MMHPVTSQKSRRRVIPRGVFTRGAIAFLAAAALSACDRGAEPDPPSSQAEPPGVEQLVPEVVRRMPHDHTAYTQGLVFRGDTLLESTGRYGESTLRVLDRNTGEVLRSVSLPANVFAEGLASLPDALVMITWKEMIAYYFDPSTLEVTREVAYEGEGWGLCYDGTALYMTTGGDHLLKRDPATFALLAATPITRGGMPLGFVNELECAGEYIWANVYQTLKIVKIEKSSGKVVAEVDASSIVPFGIDISNPDQVLNGIAYDPGTETFFVTGKLWTEMLEVRFVPR